MSKDNEKMHFVPVESIQKKADEEYKRQKRFLNKLIPGADIQHVGSTAVPGSITKGDLDIQVRVSLNDFDVSLKLLEEHYRPNHKDEIWTKEFASFENYSHPTIPVGIQLTIKGSSYDEFYKMRDLFINDKKLLNRYNDIKKQCEGKTYLEYHKRKRQLFGLNGANKFLKE